MADTLMLYIIVVYACTSVNAHALMNLIIMLFILYACVTVSLV